MLRLSAQFPARRRRRGASALLVAAALSSAGAQRPEPGIYAMLHGWGHACSGELHLTPRTLKWVSSFATCGPSGYRIVEQDETGQDIDRVYQLLHPGKSCYYPYIALRYSQAAHDRGVLAWSVEGFETRDDLDHRQEHRGLGCQLEEWSFTRVGRQ